MKIPGKRDSDSYMYLRDRVYPLGSRTVECPFWRSLFSPLTACSLADSARSGMPIWLQLNPSAISGCLYRFSTATNSSDSILLFVLVFSAYPRIIQKISRRRCIPSGLHNNSVGRLGLATSLIKINRGTSKDRTCSQSFPSDFATSETPVDFR